MRLGEWVRALTRKGIAALAGSVLAAMLLAGPAAAVNVTVGGVTYDVTFLGFNRSYVDDAAAIQASPWWGNPTLAADIANAYLAQIGVGGSPFTDNPDPGTIGYFAFGESSLMVANDAVSRAQVSEGNPSVPIPPEVSDSGQGLKTGSGPNEGYFTGTIVPPVPVPEIDGNALFKALFCLFTLALWLEVRRRRVAG